MKSTLNEHIEQFIEECLNGSSFFLVDLYISNNQRKVELCLDGDDGITIDKCAEISRLLGTYIEEKSLIDNAYQLYVSSPGVDRPLGNLRQYNSRKGRNFVLNMNDGNTIKGILKEVDGAELVFDIEKKEKGKKKITRQLKTINFDEIEKAVVKLSFK